MPTASQPRLLVLVRDGVVVAVLAAAILFSLSFVFDWGAVVIGAFGVHLLTTWVTLLSGASRARIVNLLLSIAITMFMIGVVASGQIRVFDPPSFAILAIALIIVVLNGILPFWRERSRPGRCPTCGYDLRAHPRGSTCPECGNP